MQAKQKLSVVWILPTDFQLMTADEELTVWLSLERKACPSEKGGREVWARSHISTWASRILQGGGLPSFPWLPLAHLLPEFFWVISWPHYFFFFLLFIVQKLKPLICLLLYSFPAILMWFPTRGEANAWTQLPPWTWNLIILTLFKFLWCLQHDSLCYSLISELLETLPKVLAIRIIY